MALETAIIGLPKSGKTTIFNALTHGKADTKSYGGASAPNIGMAKVLDPRLKKLEAMYRPQRTVPAEMKFIDVTVFLKGFGKGEGIGGQLLNDLSRVGALLVVVRSFRDESVPHPENTIDPKRDIATLNLELAFSDLAIQEKRLEKLVSSMKAAKSPEKERLLKEKDLLDRIKSSLEQDIPVRAQKLNEDERKILSNYQFLTAKPLLIAVNVDEEQLAHASEIEADLLSLCGGPLCDLVAVCGKLEMELAGLSDDEAVEFRKSMSAGISALEQVVHRFYKMVGLITFFTVGEDEVKAWTITQGTTAVKAAGKIHSDLERGFIRAEVIGYEELMRLGSIAEARRQGILRLEGKNYVVKDGDVMTILFNV
ncbi:MAG: redox-regulated ATPase YchF [Chloroflexi bacterium]|nr:redox-regulated ATPase YchF [Chloroflexota bacterium]